MKRTTAIFINVILVCFMSAKTVAQSVSARADREGNAQATQAKMKQPAKTTAVFGREFSITFATNVESPNGAEPEAIGNVLFGHKEDKNGNLTSDKIIFRNIGFKDACYAYNIQVEFLNDPYRPRFRVSFQEYDRDIAGMLREMRGLYGCADKKDVLPITHLPEPQLIAEGDTIALEILSNPQTGFKIVDLIQVARDNGQKDKTKGQKSR